MANNEKIVETDQGPVPADWMKTAIDTTIPDTFNLDWFEPTDPDTILDVFDTTDTDTSSSAIDSIDHMLNAYKLSFGLGDGPTSPWTVSPSPKTEDESMIPEVSQRTMDKLTPAIAIGVGEILTRAGDFKLPEGLQPKLRAGGVKGTAYMLAIRANKLGYDFAREKMGMTELGAGMTGGAAAYGVWKGIPRLIETIGSNIKIGMTATAIEATSDEAYKSAYKEVIKQGTRIGASKASAEASAKLLAIETKEQVTEESIKVLKERMGKEAAKGWDDVAERLIRPGVAKRVGMFLAKVAPATAAKLAGSVGAVVLPEPVSTAIGGLGLLLTAYDIFELSQQMPELYKLIFEDVPEKPIEDQLINEMKSADSISVLGHSPLPEQRVY